MSGFSMRGNDAEIVNSTLGFQPREFFGEVSGMVDENLELGVATFKKELLTIAREKGYKNVTENVIGESCQNLLTKLKSTYNKNIDKFDLYAKRNIFILPPSSRDSKVNASQESLDRINRELDEARQQYMDLQAQHNQKKIDIDDGEALLKEMQDVLFKIRVGSQVLDEYNVQPLTNTVHTITQNREALEELSRKAKETVIEIEKVFGVLDEDGESAGGSAETINGGTRIKAASASKSGKLTSALR